MYNCYSINWNEMRWIFFVNDYISYFEYENLSKWIDSWIIYLWFYMMLYIIDHDLNIMTRITHKLMFILKFFVSLHIILQAGVIVDQNDRVKGFELIFFVHSNAVILFLFVSYIIQKEISPFSTKSYRVLLSIT